MLFSVQEKKEDQFAKEEKKSASLVPLDSSSWYLDLQKKKKDKQNKN